MSTNINDKQYILHYKAYNNQILYFRDRFPTINDCCTFSQGDAAIEVVKNNELNDYEIKIPNQGYIYTNYGLDVEESNIHEEDDFTIYFRIRFDEPTDSEYHILSEGQSILLQDKAYYGYYYYYETDGGNSSLERDIILKYSFLLYIFNYNLYLLHGITNESLEEADRNLGSAAYYVNDYGDTSEIIFQTTTQPLKVLTDRKQHHIAVTRHAGIFRAYLDGHKIYEAEKKDEHAFFSPSWQEGPQLIYEDEPNEYGTYNVKFDENNIPLTIDDPTDPEYKPDPHGKIWANINVGGGKRTNKGFYLNDIVVCKGFAFYRYFDFVPVPDDVIDPKPTYYRVNVNTETHQDTRVDYHGDFKSPTEYNCLVKKEVKSPTEYNYLVKAECVNDLERDIRWENKKFKFSTKRNCLIKIRYNYDLERKYIYKDLTYLLPTCRNVLMIIKPKYDTKYNFLLNSDNTHPKFNTKRNILYNIKDISIPNSKDMRNPTIYKCLVNILNGGLKSHTKRNVIIKIEHNSDTKIITAISIKPKFDTYYKLLISKLDPNNPLLKGDLKRNVEETWYLITPINLMALIIKSKDTKRFTLKKIQVKFATKRCIKTHSKPFVNFVYNPKIQLLNYNK